MDDLLQPKFKVNRRMLECDFGHNRKHMENVLKAFEADYAVCHGSDETKESFKVERMAVCKYCTNQECLQDALLNMTQSTDLDLIRRYIGYLKLYGMFRPEDFLLMNPDNEMVSSESEAKIRILEDEVRRKFSAGFFMYRDLFLYPPKKCGGIQMSPYEVRIILMELLAKTFAEYYDSLHIRLEEISHIAVACTQAKEGIPNFYKTLFTLIDDQDWNIYFEGLHPRIISALLNRYNECESLALEKFFTGMGMTTDKIFERMDKYEVKNMEYFKNNHVSEEILARFQGYKVMKRYPVVYKFVKTQLGG